MTDHLPPAVFATLDSAGGGGDRRGLPALRSTVQGAGALGKGAGDYARQCRGRGRSTGAIDSAGGGAISTGLGAVMLGSAGGGYQQW
jgi:hypothetical protein